MKKEKDSLATLLYFLQAYGKKKSKKKTPKSHSENK